MIDFLYPALLATALAAAIPVLLHLMRRRDVRRLTFPAIRYLRQAEQRHARRLRLRHILLLAARVLIVLLAAAAAAGPLVGRGGPADHEATALAIIIDDSQSSSQIAADRRVIDLHVERTLAALDLVNPDDRIALFSATEPERGAVTTDRLAASDYLRDLQPAARLASLPDAVMQAQAWLSSQGDRARELHVLTDLQHVSLASRTQSSTDTALSGRGVAAVVYVPDHEPQPNGSIGPPTPELLPLSAGRETRVSVPLHWFGADRPADPVVVRLVRGDDVIAVAEGSFGSVALLRLPPQDSGWVRGYVETTRHGLAADDRRYFAWFARPLVRLAVTGEAGTFLEHALTTLENGRRLELTSPITAEVWLADGGSRIEEGLNAGKSVIVIPSASGLDLPLLNSRLSRARVPWRYEATQGTHGVTRIAAGAPLDGLAGLEVRQFYRLTPAGLAPVDTALIRLDDEQPWLVRGVVGGAVYLLLASPLTPAASDVPVSAEMVPFVDALVGDWARRGVEDPASVEGNEPIRLPARARTLTGPDAVQVTVEGGAWYRASQAGYYTVSDGERDLLAFAVNAPLTEADLARGNRAELERVLPDAEWSWTDATRTDEWQASIFRARRGKLSWRPLVGLLLLVSIVEAALAAAGRRQEVKPGSMGEST